MVFLGAPELVSHFVVKSKIPEVTPYYIIVCPIARNWPIRARETDPTFISVSEPGVNREGEALTEEKIKIKDVIG